jgi:hypothetical protein
MQLARRGECAPRVRISERRTLPAQSLEFRVYAAPFVKPLRRPPEGGTPNVCANLRMLMR